MRALTGVCLTALAGLLAGNLAADRLHSRAEDLRSIESALRVLQTGICVSRTPLPDLLERCSKRLTGAGGALFASVAAAAAPDVRFSQQWRQGVGQCGRCGDAAPVLLMLEAVLGQYDAPQQEAELLQAIGRISELAQIMEARARQQSPMCRKLGLAGGLFLAILLL